MAICQRCHKKWTWKETFASMFTFKKAITCPKCRGKQYITRDSRNNLSIIPTFVAMLWLPLVLVGIKFPIIIAIEITTSLIVLLLLPFFYKVTNEEESMW
ncbi:TIGR04104 family putative zinc finger protein [Pseudalkalibacillus hwajinpoensis]|uniref:TIGR04104 family putative zinc finger protein n=1 Tax=Guptibacillus hwajinpoensis TaxID=208199 RepID=UPI00325B528A